MVSHIDGDHIQGLTDMAGALVELKDDSQPLPYEVGGLWHNAFDDVLGNRAAEVPAASAPVVASVEPGPDAARPGDPRSGGRATSRSPRSSSRRARCTFGAAKLTVVAPDATALDKLDAKWEEWLSHHPEAVQVAGYDDHSVFNLSSIVVLAEAGGKSMLLCGDARGDHVLTGLETAGKLAAGGTLALDILKLPHHGSIRNVDHDFFARLPARHYLISADGRDGNPESATLEAIAASRADDDFEIHLTNHAGQGDIAQRLDAFVAARDAAGRGFGVSFREEAALGLRIDLGDPAMSTLDDLQARATALLTRTESTASVEAKVASTEGPSSRFSAFIPSELDRATALAGDLMKIREEQDVDAALDEAERRAETEDVGLVRHALGMFIVHDAEASRLALPPTAAARAAARGGAARGRDRARGRARLVARGPGGQRPPQPLAPRLPDAGPAGHGRGSRTARASCSSTCTSRCWPATTPSGARSASAPSCRSPTTASRSTRATRTGRAARRCGTSTAADLGLTLTVDELESQRDRLLAAVEAGAVQNGGAPIPLTEELLGHLEEPTRGTPWRDVWHHGYGHVITAFVMAPNGGGEPGDIGDPATAIRDPFFWRWHRHIDDLGFAFEQRPRAVRVRRRARRRADRPSSSRSRPTRRPPSTSWSRCVAETDGVEHGDHEPFLWRLRAENPGAEERTVTVRIFIAPAEAAEDRRAWIEMDKFEHALAPGANEIERPGRLASPVRKPAERPPVWAQGPAQTPHEQYCRCGWPYHLLLPRGTVAGMPFRVLAMLTDWELDRVSGDDDCGSMSFCGARDRYPDRREMGYPFSRPLPGGVAGDARGAAHRARARPHDPPRPAPAGLTWASTTSCCGASRRTSATTPTSSTSPTAPRSGPTAPATCCGRPAGS